MAEIMCPICRIPFDECDCPDVGESTGSLPRCVTCDDDPNACICMDPNFP